MRRLDRRGVINGDDEFVFLEGKSLKEDQSIKDGWITSEKTNI
jgi:hypothetical protein